MQLRVCYLAGSVAVQSTLGCWPGLNPALLGLGMTINPGYDCPWAIDHATPMDIAFQVCDPRLDRMGDGGIHIFARTFQPRLLVPIHAFGRYDFNAVVEKRLRAEGFKNGFWCVRGRGEAFALPQCRYS